MTSSRALFEIKVAFLGPIGSGKTTVLNCLLGYHHGYTRSANNSYYSEDTKATTAVHHYRINTASTANLPNLDSIEESEADASYYPKSNITSVHSSVAAAAKSQASPEMKQNLLQQAAATRISSKTKEEVEEIYEEVQLDSDLLEMRHDAQLVLVDIPGLECSDTTTASNTKTCPYTQYVQQHWREFDCIVIVLDVTSKMVAEQERLLHFIQRNLQTQQRLPVICLWNKLDDPFDPVYLEVITKTQQLVNLMLHPPEPTFQNMPRITDQNQIQSRHHSVPFQLLHTSEPYTFGPPMTEQQIERQKQKQRQAFITTKADDTSDMTPPEGFGNPKLKEPGEGYVVVAKPQQQSTNGKAQESSLFAPSQKSSSEELEPALQFLPMSAKTALVYKRVTNVNMTMEQLADWMDQDWMVEKLAREIIGLKQWNILGREQQIQEAFAVLSDPNESMRALDSCGYTAFQNTLNKLVGNHHGMQTTILEQQMERSLNELLSLENIEQSPPLSYPSFSLLAPQMHSVYTKFQALYGSTEASMSLPTELQSAFWAAYETLEVSSLKVLLDEGPTNVSALSEPLEQLFSFHSICQLLDWQEGTAAVLKRSKGLVLKYFQLLLEQESIYSYSDWGASFQSTKNDSSRNPWMSLSPKDWMQMWGSVLLLSYDKHFCQNFGREKLLIEELLGKAKEAWNLHKDTKLRLCPHCGAPLQPYQNEWRCDACRFAFLTCYPSTLCSECQDHRFDEDNPATTSIKEPHVCPANGFTYSAQQNLQLWMKTFYNRSQTLEPVYPNVYHQVVQTGMIPESLSDPHHMGHVVCQFCILKEMIDEHGR